LGYGDIVLTAWLSLSGIKAANIRMNPSAPQTAGMGSWAEKLAPSISRPRSSRIEASSGSAALDQ
jgi:hypothetical protein